MAKKNRSEMFNPRVRGTYHVYSRCVRQTWLLSKGDRDRRARLLEILEELAAIYAIAVLASAFLSNHFHLVLVNLPELVDRWSDREVLLRAQLAYPHRFARMGIHGPPDDEQMRNLLKDYKLIEEMRSRLSDISWMMRLLKQRFAVEMNHETGDEGHFWAGRFKMVEILNVEQLITTMVYVALNQMKAGQASTLDRSFWTSVCWQLDARQLAENGDAQGADRRAGFLAPLCPHGPPPPVPGGQLGSRRASDQPALELSMDEFIQLTETAFALHRGTRDPLSSSQTQLIERTQLTPADLQLAVDSVAKR